jgi:hypothetical protein
MGVHHIGGQEEMCIPKRSKLSQTTAKDLRQLIIKKVTKKLIIW